MIGHQVRVLEIELFLCVVAEDLVGHGMARRGLLAMLTEWPMRDGLLPTTEDNIMPDGDIKSV